MSDSANFDELLSSYFEGIVSADELRQLEHLLLTDDALLERASEQSLLHRQVFELLTEQRLHQMMDEFGSGAKAVPNAMRSAITSDQSGTAPPPSTHVWKLAAGAACLAASVMAIALWQRPSESNTAEVAEQPTAIDSENAVATLTQLSQARWKASARQHQFGEPLSGGSRIALESGMAKVTFECGAEVMLQGPCDFVIRDEMVGILREGKIAANVPRRAFAFAILSPSVDFVDLGTSFGISVDKSGKSELHVFEGEVLYSPNDGAENTRNESVHVTAQQAVGFETNGHDAEITASDIEINEDQFSPLLALRRATPKHDAPLSGAHLALWLTADSGVSHDENQRVLSWQDIVSDDNRTAEDATQSSADARPLWVPNAIGSHAAVRFDGHSDYLVTTPLETTDDQTVFLVCQFSANAFAKGRQWGGQILNYDGPPSREASNTFAPGILQIGEPLLETEFQPTLITGQVFAGFIGSAVVESGRVDGPPVGANEPVIVAYHYDYTQGQATLAINGRVLDRGRAFAPQALTSRKIIGRHAWKELFFSGDLAELLIYNKSLTATELGEATTYLADKYGILLVD